MFAFPHTMKCCLTHPPSLVIYDLQKIRARGSPANVCKISSMPVGRNSH